MRSRPRPDAASALVAIDVDGTLLDSDHRLSGRTRAVLESAAQAGIAVAIVSSRSIVGIRNALGGLEIEDLWLCGFQGALVIREKRGTSPQTLRDLEIPAIEVGDVLEQVTDEHLSVSHYRGAAWRVMSETPAVLREAGITGQRPILDEAGAFGELPAHKLQLLAPPESIPLLHRIRERLPASCTGAFSHDDYLEITVQGATKAACVRLIANALDIDMGRVAAIGDELNDISMIETAGVGIAMGNANPAVKDVARWVAPTNDDDGVAYSVERLATSWGFDLKRLQDG